MTAVRPRASFWALCLIGLVAGFLSGLFGVGGGIVVVPALVSILGFPQKLATGTSLLAIAPVTLVGALSYTVLGTTDWAYGLLLAAGAVAGGLVGSWLLTRLPSRAVALLFVVFLLVVAVRLVFTQPSSDATPDLTLLGGVLLVVVGFVAGVLSGVIGVGGGIVIVPALVLGGGVGDLVAKGSSLIAIAPSSITTSVANLRRRNADLRAGLIIGIAGCASTVAGSYTASVTPTRVAAVAFACFLVLVAAQMLWRQFRRPTVDN
ncbi:MAG: sulfite exporter TauE/SafE family protein [Herbiconiux sp.]|uniref:sulfite exporter TauE/SafE family protein n=1 Tax=Herbiconiux sp. TaxID=1871186 RepID=UPI001229B4DB|nr:sulfite exporter TauE/SafE family protein [Herbiconiux sp.]TAJ48103.1 MAG: sulfite exporter TauE/SafE family protein [Herbiconiux sp.]